MLTEEQYAAFKASQRCFIWVMTFSLTFFSLLVLVGQAYNLESIGLGLAVFSLILIALIIWSMHGYRCPACGETPRARMWGLGASEMQYSSMVALKPKKCSSCGISFAKPAHMETPKK